MVAQDRADLRRRPDSAPGPDRRGDQGLAPSVARNCPALAPLLTGWLVVAAAQALFIVLNVAQPRLWDSLPGFLSALMRGLLAATPSLLAVVFATYGLTLVRSHSGRGRSPSADAGQHQHSHRRTS